MLPIAQIYAEALLRHSLQGANGTDPVARPKARRRYLKRRGTS
jgi:hypothetical protein